MKTRRIIQIAGVALIGALLLASCSSPTSSKRGDAIVTGSVIRTDLNVAIPGVTVFLPSKPSVVAVTDAYGNYSLTVRVDSTTISSIVAVMSGFKSDTETVVLQANQTVAVNLYLKGDSTSPKVPSTSGSASSINVQSFIPSSVSVTGTGSNTVAQLIFQVRDANGIAVDSVHGIDVSFDITNGPGGGEYVFPSTGHTSTKDGTVAVNLNSGTKSGVVQIRAHAQVGALTIESLPVRLTINGGLPDQTHFSIAPLRYNFPGLDVLGRIDNIAVLVGDKYSNPVQPNTAVYFACNGGVIDASGFTNANGVANVQLYSGNPIPTHPTLGPGYATLTARTVGEGGTTVSGALTILFSGFPVNMQFMNTTPFYLNNTDTVGIDIHYRVADTYGHPMSEGTTITAKADGAPVVLSGDVSVTLPDVISGYTDYVLHVSRNTSQQGALSGNVAITVTTTGQNGARSISLNGYVAY